MRAWTWSSWCQLLVWVFICVFVLYHKQSPTLFPSTPSLYTCLFIYLSVYLSIDLSISTPFLCSLSLSSPLWPWYTWNTKKYINKGFNCFYNTTCQFLWRHMGAMVSQITTDWIVLNGFSLFRLASKVNIKAPHCWPLVRGIHRYPEQALYNGCNSLSMLGLKLSYVSKRGPRYISISYQQ